MDSTELNQRLSRMSTMWTVVLQAHGSEADEATAALAGLAQQYSGVVYRYLLGAVRDPDTAAELSQEFTQLDATGKELITCAFSGRPWTRPQAP
jgi:hypothetical protein